MLRQIGVLAVLFTLLGLGAAFGQPEESEEVVIMNPKFSMVRDTVIIEYTLTGGGDDPLNVRVFLRKGDDSTFSIEPKSVVGAVGTVRGRGRMLILWNYKEDVPPSFAYDDDYWFEIKTSPIVAGFTPTVWHYVVAGGIVAGTIALLSSGGGDSPSAIASGLPDPPIIRPDP